MRLIRKTEQACLLTNRKSNSESTLSKIEVWIPRSLMGTTSTIQDDPNFPLFSFSLPEWLIEQKKLWDFTTS